MPKIFGFSRRRKKVGRLKVQLADSSQGTRSPFKPSKRLSQTNDGNGMPAPSDRYNNLNSHCSSNTVDLHRCSLGTSKNWEVLPTYENKPTPRFHHAAAVVGSKILVVGGDSGNSLLNDTQSFSLDTLTWVASSSKLYCSPGRVPLKIPACKGHSLVTWGNTVLLVGGKTDPPSDKLSVWSFDVEAEIWSYVEVKGNIPVARSGQTVLRAGTVLILFGGEDVKGRKLNDLFMFDLKSLTWLPLHYKGTGPSARSNHVAAIYEDRLLFIFGGQSKSRILNDLYSLDFETMIWSRVKAHGNRPSPRAGCCGALCGTKWYITGGGSKRRRHAETWVFDVQKLVWSICVVSPSVSITTYKGFILLLIHHKDKLFLLAFGGYKKEASNQIEILLLVTDDHSVNHQPAPDTEQTYEDFGANIKEFGAHLMIPSSNSMDHVARHSLASAFEQHVSGRKSLSDDPSSTVGISLREKLHQDQDYGLPTKVGKALEDEIHKIIDQLMLNNPPSQRNKRQETDAKKDIAGTSCITEEIHVESEGSIFYQKQGKTSLTSDTDPVLSLETNGRSVLANPSIIYQLYETKMASLTRKNIFLEEQLKAVLTRQEDADVNLSTAAKSNEEMERKLAIAFQEVELLKEKLTGLELAQEEANNHSNIAHSDNVRLEHDVAFLKAILDDTKKELHSTRGVLAGERARAFQLQVEVFHLKQRLLSMENRAPTPRKPFQI